LATSR